MRERASHVYRIDYFSFVHVQCPIHLRSFLKLCLHFPFQDISFKVLLCEQLRKNWQTGKKQKHYGNLGREIESKESLLFQIWVDIFLCVSFIFPSSIACWPCCGMDDVDNKWTTFMLYSDDFIIWCAVLVGPCHVKCKCYISWPVFILTSNKGPTDHILKNE